MEDPEVFMVRIVPALVSLVLASCAFSAREASPPSTAERAAPNPEAKKEALDAASPEVETSTPPKLADETAADDPSLPERHAVIDVLKAAEAPEDTSSSASLEEVLGELGTGGSFGVGGLDGAAHDVGGLIGTKGLGAGGAGYGGSGLGGSLAPRGHGSGRGGALGEATVTRGSYGSAASSHRTVEGGEAYLHTTRPVTEVPQSVPMRPLRAGSTDDNAALDSFVRFLAEEGASGRLGRLDRIDIRDQAMIRVLDGTGEPVPSASVEVLNDGATIWRGETYGDGRLPYYPRQFGERVSQVRVTHQGVEASIAWDATDEVTVRLDVAPVERVQLDVALVLDTTGSMGDEIAAIKATLREVTQRLRADDRAADLRFGAVLYRDISDRYVTRTFPFSSLDAFERLLEQVEADGGGDTPEALHEALEVTVDELKWREDAARVAFVIADAPPKLHQGRPHGESAAIALSKGIRIHTVAASGLDRMGSLVFRRIAQLTRGKFIFIEYGGDLSGSAAAHGVGGQIQSNNLDAILYRELQAELDGWGVWVL